MWSGGVSPSTAHGYEFYVRKYIIPALGRHQIRKLTPEQVQRFLNETHAKGLAPRTVQYIRAILRRALNQALRWELVARNVATLADPPTGRSPEMRPLTTETRASSSPPLAAIATSISLHSSSAQAC